MFLNIEGGGLLWAWLPLMVLQSILTGSFTKIEILRDGPQKGVDKQIDTQINRQMDRFIDRQIDKQTDGQIYRQIDRFVDRYMFNCRDAYKNINRN